MSRARSLCVLLGAAVVAACSDGTSPAPTVTVTSVSPSSGPLAGGTAVTLTGANFPATVDSVRVGTGRLGSLVRVSGTQLTGTTPAGSAAGATDVTVYTTSAGSGTCTGCFTYNPAATWTTLTAGEGHTCGVTSGGAAYCWGRNGTGELGDGSTTRRMTPVAVAGELTFQSVTAGYGHTCGVTSGGVAYSWGSNFWGQLGHGDTLLASTPVAVAGGLTFSSLTAGAGHTCGVTSGGAAAYCWGQNNVGELGDRSTTRRMTPVAVAGGLTFAAVTAGFYHTCGVTSVGAGFCWGGDSLGVLGDGSSIWMRTAPVAVVGGLTFASVTAGATHTCGVTSSGAAYCWGRDFYGELGDGSTTDRPTPVAVVNP